MKKLFVAIIFLSVFSESNATDLGFRFKDGKCVNSSGSEGLNPLRAGQCGDWRRSSLQKINFRKFDLSGSRFDSSDLEGADLSGATLSAVNFVAAILIGANFTDASGIQTNFSKAQMKNVSLAGVSFEHADFSEADLSNGNYAYLKLRSANLRGANFANSFLEDSDLTSSDLSAASFLKCSMDRANLSQARLAGTNFVRANLIGANLSATTGSPRFLGANLRRVVLREARLIKSDLRRAKLELSDLTGAEFLNSDLRAGNFSKAKVVGTKFLGSVYSAQTQLPFSSEVAHGLGMIFRKGSALIIWERTEALRGLKEVLEKGEVVTHFSNESSEKFVGQSEINEVDAVIHFGSGQDMPWEGQIAVRKFVENGGTYIHGGWDASSLGSGRLKALREISILDHATPNYGALELMPSEGQETHPLLKDIPKTFRILDCHHGRNPNHRYASNAVQTLVTDVKAKQNVVSVRQHDLGRSVGFALLDYFNARCWNDTIVSRLILNAVNWQ